MKRCVGTSAPRKERKKYLADFARQKYRERRAVYFADKCCVDCGGRNNLELDHVDPAQKVTHNIWNWGQERREEELKKCVVRCHHHHKLRSAEQHRKPIIHGTMNGYCHGRCRCEPCRVAWSVYRKARYKKFGE